MRTPGRCTNFDTCWLANGQRDIRVMVGDPFVCPACGEALHAPSIESISANGILGALAVSLAMVATAGGAGYGLVRVAQSAGTVSIASLQSAPVQPRALAPAVPSAGIESLGRTSLAASPAINAQTVRLAASVPALQVDPSIPAVVFVAAAPAHPLVLPINFGRPHAPEDDAPAQSPRWHHHAFSTRHHSSYVSAPVDASSDEGETGTEASAPDQAANDIALPDAGAESVPAQQADTAVPAATRVSSHLAGRGAIARLIVPALASLRDMVSYHRV